MNLQDLAITHAAALWGLFCQVNVLWQHIQSTEIFKEEESETILQRVNIDEKGFALWWRLLDCGSPPGRWQLMGQSKGRDFRFSHSSVWIPAWLRFFSRYFEESIERKNPSSTKADAGFCKWSKLKRPEARILKKIMNYQ